jgi:hypothetical protein
VDPAAGRGRRMVGMTLRDWIESCYYRWYGCRRGRHKMKLSGCVYCGEGNEQVRFNVRGPG